MPTFRNDGEIDIHVLGFGFPQGIPIDVPEDYDPDKLAYFAAQFTEVTKDAGAAVEAAPEVDEPAGDATFATAATTTSEPATEVQAPCGKTPPEDHENPQSWLIRHMARCLDCPEA